MTLVKRWALEEDFNPLSPLQVMHYLKHMKYKLPMDRKTRKPTTGKEGLSFLSRKYGDQLLTHTLTSRRLSKARSYLDDTYLAKDGRLHPTFTTRPDTGRLSSLAPNLQNQPHHGVDQELVDIIRSTIIPSPGMVFVELDWKAIEAVLTGWFAGDEGFITLSLQDSHSY
ncbi:MAG: DNA polymerase, partial [Nitrospiria bacterium]